MNGKSHIINHRTEKFARKLNIPEANIIDLRRAKQQRTARSHQRKRRTLLFLLSELFSKIKLPRLLFSGQAENKSPREKIIVSQVRPRLAPTTQKLVQGEKRGVVKDSGQIAVAALAHNASPSEVSELPVLPQTGWLKRLVAFAVVCLVIVVPIFVAGFYEKAQVAKGTVLGISATALETLQKAEDASYGSQFDLAGQEFSKASEQFRAAKQELDQVGGVIFEVAKIIPGTVQSANALLEAGNDVSEAGRQLTELIKELEGSAINPLASDQSSLTELLSQIKIRLVPVGELISDATSQLEKVRAKDLPDEYRARFAEAQQSLPTIRDKVNDFFSLSEVLLTVLGQQTPKRYLFIFQNNRELRPTGGFIGSIALMDIYKGKIENLEVPGGGVYDLAGQLKERIIAPKPLWLVNPYWNIQDSNWFPDFPTSARKLAWFYERTGGATVDGIISLTPTVIEDLLKIVGPIDLRETYGVTVDENNFVREAQRWAEVTYNQEENKPKKFIGDLLPLLLDKVFQVETDNLLRVLQVFNDSLVDKNFLFYFSDAAVQQAINSKGWDGSVASADKDYLYVVATNIGGGKTDHVVDQLVEHQAEIQSDGSIIDTVTVTRAHHGHKLDLWESVANVSYLRFYVPAGSQLISASGFSEIPAFRYQLPEKDAQQDEDLPLIEGDSVIDEKTNTRLNSEFGKTVFGNWLSVNPGEVGRVTIQYRLPLKLEVGGLFSQTDSYSLLVQKQPGLINNYFVGTIKLDPAYQLVWQAPGVIVEDNKAQYLTDLTRDTYYGLVLRK